MIVLKSVERFLLGLAPGWLGKVRSSRPVQDCTVGLVVLLSHNTWSLCLGTATVLQSLSPGSPALPCVPGFL